MTEAYIVDAIRTPIGKFGGTLSAIRTDDLGALVLKELIKRNDSIDPKAIKDVIMGCANQAGEDNRNVARMSGLLAGLPIDVPGMTLNRLCGSGIDAVGTGARAIRSGEANLIIAGGVESMSRAPFVVAKANTAFSRQAEMFDTTIGWRFINPLMKQQYGVDSMPETAENVAVQFGIDRTSQDAFAFSSQTRAAKAQADGIFAEEIVPVRIPQRKKQDSVFSQDEHLRLSSLETLSQLATPFREGGSVTAGNASGVNDGSCALLLASSEGAKRHGLTPQARILGMATAGLEPNIMGYGPVAATLKVLKNTGLSLNQMDVIELNEAFAAQGLAVMRALGINDDAGHVNPNGGAIALGHPLGASGARLVTTAMYQLHRTNGQYALCTMCIGVGQGIALIIERV